ncbi:MAG: 2-polyprenyl-3-methyl-5-hydroxy-6-metoxy-1,4-benzoquinol methylase [Moritella sp.]|jgi:2-polyprenyl-3-methyl-5-hydroxy-6-metoxy-1,4-benzoquinol methylase
MRNRIQSTIIYETDPTVFRQENVRLIPKGNVLCLAEGEGRNAVFLAKRGYSVTAVDASLVGLEKARKLAKDNGVAIEFIHADLEAYDIGKNRWEGIVSIFCHVPEQLRKTSHKKVVSVLGAVVQVIASD